MAGEGLILKEAVQVVQWTPAHPSPAALQAGDIMARHVVTVRPETPVAEIVGLLLGRHFKGVPVVDNNQHVVGIITDTDLMTRGAVPVRLGMLAELDDEQLQAWLMMVRKSPARAADIMTRQVVTVRPEMPVLKVAQLMRDQKLKRLPVVDARGHLAGILSRVDILRALAGRLGPATDTGEQPAPHPGQPARTVRDILLPDVPVVQPDDPITVVRDRLLDSPLRRVLVVDDRRHVLGMVTDVDLVRRLTPESWTQFLQRVVQRVPNAPGTAREVMTSPIQTLTPEMSISAATRIILSSELKLLPVVDAEGRLLGAVNRSTLLTTMLDELPPSQPAPGTPPR
jgi:CBS domain-containing protein